MSNRERWIIYPLLFLAISLAVKTQMDQAQQVETDLVRCRQLVITSPDNQARIELIGGEKSGALAIVDPRGVERVVLRTDDATGEGRLDIGGPDRTALVRLQGTGQGGQLQLIHDNGQLEIVAGFGQPPAQAGILALLGGNPLHVTPDESSSDLWGLPLPPTDSKSPKQEMEVETPPQ